MHRIAVQSDIRAFGIAGYWKATALEAEVSVETVTDGGRMAAWRKEEVGAARHRQEKKEKTRLGKKVVIAHGSVEFCQATPFNLVESVSTIAPPPKPSIVCNRK